ncbi:MAG: DUF4386 domain-containing protein [Gammaproteobacteria bacterium]|nr:DUF4386 domain-containing protein [Gammaproteobacteria bacterium]
MKHEIQPRTLALIAGGSYWFIFFAAIFANFFAIESLKNDPLVTVQQNDMLVRFGIVAFMITVIFDVVVAWALNDLFRTNPLTLLSTFFRMMHAVIMGVAIFALPGVLALDSGEEILKQVEMFNTIWLIGLFFFGLHIILLGKILGKPILISVFLVIAGSMYMLDTLAHFVLPDYQAYADIFLALVAIPSILGEMSFAVWLLLKGGKS